MYSFANSKDGQSIHFRHSGKGEVTLFFVHGWLGNLNWWDNQCDTFAEHYQIVQMDLVGHGKSSKTRQNWSIESFAKDIQEVIKQLDLKNVVLIGHSMSGSIVVQAANSLPNIVKKIILVDTIQHVAKMPTMAQVAPLFDGLRSDYQGTITNMVPMFMFAKTSPSAVKKRIISEFAAGDPDVAISSLEPFYSTPIEELCRSLNIPVRAIQSDLYPTDPEMNRAYFKDYDLKIIAGVGHYPMLEAPTEFNSAMREFLQDTNS
jgi:pimeloyl-ACP methyl ester carboxylesterase